MKHFSKFPHKPQIQRADQPEVEFELRDLDQRTFYTMNTDIGPSGMVGATGAFAAVEFGLVGWSGLEPKYSASAKRDLLNSPADPVINTWIMEIAATLYKRALLPEAERKNS